MKHRRHRTRFRAVFCWPLAAATMLLLSGCPTPSEKDGQPQTLPFAGITLKLVVVDDPAMAEAIGRLPGEWAAQTGGDLTISTMSEADLMQAKSLPADAAIVPSWCIGPLADADRLASLPPTFATTGEGDWPGIFDLLRVREATWGNRIVAVPFGSPCLVCYYRADLLERLQRRPPKTWEEYQSLAAALANREALGDLAAKEPWHACAEPLGPGWGGITLIARAAAYAKHPSNYSTLFDIRTMDPLLSGPPFVRALEELVAAAQHGPAEQLTYTPDDVRRLFWEGKAGMALTWPTAAAQFAAPQTAASPGAEANGGNAADSPDAAGNFAMGFVELPGAAEVFDVGSRQWGPRENQHYQAEAMTASEREAARHVTLLSIAGRSGVVAANSPHGDAALKLLLWLSGDQNSPQISPRSGATTLFRTSHLSAPQLWVERPAAAEAAKYAVLTEQTLSRPQWLGALRLPGRAEYLAALDQAVADAVRGTQPPREALIEAEHRWQEITRRLGVEKQLAAYRHGLGLE